jgi:hypothetical protein
MEDLFWTCVGYQVWSNKHAEQKQDNGASGIAEVGVS